MDLNNCIGANIGANSKSKVEVEEKVASAVREGKTINDPSLAPSDADRNSCDAPKVGITGYLLQRRLLKY